MLCRSGMEVWGEEHFAAQIKRSIPGRTCPAFASLLRTPTRPHAVACVRTRRYQRLVDGASRFSLVLPPVVTDCADDRRADWQSR